MRKLSKAECLLLKSNPNVLKTTTSHVVFKVSFKIKALKLNEEGMSAEEIFSMHGLNFDFFNEHYFRTCIKRWKKVSKLNGQRGLTQELRGRSLRGGRPRKAKDIKSLSKKDLLALAQVQYEVIEDLKKRKALAKKSLK